MSRSILRTGVLIAVSVFALAALGTVDGVRQHLAPGAWAGEADGTAKPRRKVRRQARRSTIESGSSPAEIARYFQLYGGYIDPSLNKQSQGGPFDSGFFFDSGIGPNGGDSPYMN
jgi:hypothetical protein